MLATGTVRFGVDYFLAPPRTAGGFHAGLEPAYRRARRLAAGRPILISNSVGIAYLYPLLFDRVRPAQFQAARAARPGPEGPLSIRNVGDVYFHRHEIPHEREGEWIALRPAGEVDPLEEIVLERVGGWALVEPRRGDATAR